MIFLHRNLSLGMQPIFTFLLSYNRRWFLYRSQYLFNEYHERFFRHYSLKSTHTTLNSRPLSHCLLITH